MPMRRGPDAAWSFSDRSIYPHCARSALVDWVREWLCESGVSLGVRTVYRGAPLFVTFTKFQLEAAGWHTTTCTPSRLLSSSKFSLTDNMPKTHRSPWHAAQGPRERLHPNGGWCRRGEGRISIRAE